jgi:DNA-binding transcriptional MocR family regulator
MLDIDRNSDIPLTDQIAEAIAGRIGRRELVEGGRLPSVRRLAQKLGVSAFTVAGAYDRLTARGLIDARPGSGYFVARASVPVPALIEAPPETPETMLGLVKATLDLAPIAVPAGTGYLPAQWMEEALPASAVARVCRDGRTLQSPCPAPGLTALREQLAGRLGQLGIAASVPNVVVTIGASQAFDLILKALLVPGDAVVVEDPGYFVLFTQLARRGLKLLPMPRQADGPDLDALEELCRLHRPRAIFVQTLLHNPTGGSISPQKCHRLLTLAERHDAMVVEDDAYGDLADANAVRLAQIDGLHRVLYVGSFTKVLSPALRVGFVAAPAALVPRLVEEKLLSIITGSALPEALVADALASGRFRRHATRLRQRLDRAKGLAFPALTTAGLRVAPGGGGLFLWAEAPHGVDIDALVREARGEGILLAKGGLFSPAGQPSSHLRINAAYATAPALTRFLGERLAA